MSGFDCFTNEKCEYFPCHAGADPEGFNCLFCYCPLYCLGDRCGGMFSYTSAGVKDCTGCLYPHKKENYDAICAKLADVIELVKSDRPNYEKT